jgi:hypothetical protein
MKVLMMSQSKLYLLTSSISYGLLITTNALQLADPDPISNTDLEFYVYPSAEKEIVIAAIPDNNIDPTYGFQLGTDELYNRVYVKEIAAKSYASNIYNNLKASRKRLRGVFITHLNGNPVVSEADAILQLQSLQDQGLKEFFITFAPERKISGKKLKQAMDNYHHFSPSTTKKIKSNSIGESPDNLDTVDDGSTRYHVGTTVYKTFSDEEFKDKVTGYDSATKLYHILYEDEDTEDYYHNEVRDQQKPVLGISKR